MRVVLGCDVGGSSVKAGVFDEEGQLLLRRSTPTPALVDDAAYAQVIDLFDRLLAELSCTREDVCGVGLDMPGAVLADGTHLMHYNLDVDAAGLRHALGEAFSVDYVPVLNDANAAALGEMWKGSAEGYSSLVFVILGTGVGGGIVVDGRLLVGARGAGGEIGHICVDPQESRSCTCGRKGCVEQYASWRGILDSYHEACEKAGVQAVDTSAGAVSVFDEFRAGDECAKYAVDRMCRALGHGLASVACVCDPDVFVIGGGVAGSFDDFHPQLASYYRQYAIENCCDIPIVNASLGSAAGLYGSAYAALSASKGERA